LAKQSRQWGIAQSARCIATGFGVGTAAPVAPGTFGTMLAIPLYLVLHLLSPLHYALVLVALFVLGVWACGVHERETGEHDPGTVVFDEVVGFLITMFMAPAGLVWVAIGFVLFRLFDIWKPFPIRRLDRDVPGGLGAMLDDAVAGVYALVAMQVLSRLIVA
jgi:phosphatidylglycerophosphatase A